MRVAFIWGWIKNATPHYFENWIDSMQHALAELSKEHSIRVYVVRKVNRGHRIINGVDFTFCDSQTTTLINHLKQFNPHMIFMNCLRDSKWPIIIKAFPKTWKGMIDHGDPMLKVPLPQKLDAIIVEREYQRKIASNVNQVPITKVLHNPYCVDTNIFKPLPVKKTHTGIMVADFNRDRKRQHLLIRAWKDIPGRLILIGHYWKSLPHRWHLECMRLAKTLGIAHKIDFMDAVLTTDELSALINKAKIAYLTSVRESGPRVLPEMMSCGLPLIVMRDCVATRDGIRHGVDGWVADPTPEGIAVATMEVLKNWQGMGIRASERSRREYPYDRMLNVYRKLIEGVK